MAQAQASTWTGFSIRRPADRGWGDGGASASLVPDGFGAGIG